jgi:hypothetical protein
MYTVNSLIRQWKRSYRHVRYWEKNSTYRDMIQCVLNCTVIYVRKWGENYTTKSCMTMYRNWYKQMLKVRLPYYGTNSANGQNCF